MPTGEELGQLLVDARRGLLALKEADDKRVRAAGEAWSAAFAAMVKLLQQGAEPSVEELQLRSSQMAAYALEGADELKRYLSSASAALPPGAAELAQQLSALLGRAREGDDVTDDGAELAERAQESLRELESEVE